MKIKNVKVDFQATGWVVEKDKPARFGALSRWFIDRTERFDKSIASTLEHAYQESQNRVMVLTDYYQPKYERVLNDEVVTALSRAGVGINDDSKNTFIGFTKDRGRSWFYLVRGKEYLCLEGHVLSVGTSTSLPTQYDWYTRGPKVKEVIDFEKEQDSILIPSHPLSILGFGTKSILRLIREPSGTNLGLQRNTLEKHAKDFDALEAYSLSMNSEQTARVEALARELGLPTVSNTDGNLLSSFVAYNNFDWLDMTNPESFRASIRAGLRGEGNKHTEHRGQFTKSLTDKINHILLNVAQGRKYF